MRMVGMTLGLATLTAWGTGRFQVLVAGIPFAPQEGETFAQAQQRFQAQTVDAGLTLFNDFFLVATGVCLVALLPAVLMVWHRTREDVA